MDNVNIKLYLGAEGIKQSYEASLKADAVDIVCLSYNYAAVIGDYFDKVYAPRLYGSTIKTREILPDTEENRNGAAKKDGRKNQVRFLKTKQPSESDLMLFGDRVFLVSYNTNAPFALEITDPELVGGFKNQYEALWESLSDTLR